MKGNEWITYSTAVNISAGMNTWAGIQYRQEIITPEEVLNLTPVKTYEKKGMLVYAYQWGDVTILAWVHEGDVTIKHICW